MMAHVSLHTPPTRPTKERMVSFRFPEHLHGLLDAAALARGCTKSEIVRVGAEAVARQILREHSPVELSS